MRGRPFQKGFDLRRNMLGNGGITVYERTPEHRILMSQKLSGRKLSLAHIENVKKNSARYWKGKKLSDATKLKLRIAAIVVRGKILKKDTGIEVKVEQELRRRMILFEKQVPLCGIARVDFLLPKKVVIQVDGDYWHSLPEVINRDRKQDDILIKSGYNVVRLKESEIKQSVEDCIDKLILV